MNLEDLFKALIAILVLLDMGIILYKGITRKDWGMIASVAPMLVFVVIYAIDILTTSSVDIYIYYLGMFLVLAGIFMSDLFIIFSRRFKLENFTTHLVEILKDLKVKYDFIVTNAPIGIYVINKLGRFEFVNKTLCDISGYSEDELYKMVIQDLLVESVKHSRLASGITRTSPLHDYHIKLRTKSGELKSVRVSAKNTTNGHATITGSILLMED